MSQFTVNLTAGAKTRLEVSGRFFMVRSVSGGATLDVLIEVRGGGDRNDEAFSSIEGGFKARIDSGKFDAVLLTASANCAVVYVISDNSVDFDFFSGASVNATVVSPLPLPVSNDRGSPGNLMHVSAVTVADTPAVSLNEPAAVAVDATVDVLVAANAARRRLVFTNIGTVNDVAIGSAAITWAKRAIVLRPGDTWVEERAANLAWSAICDAAKSTTVTVQEVLT